MCLVNTDRFLFFPCLSTVLVQVLERAFKQSVCTVAYRILLEYKQIVIFYGTPIP